jgi:hypothetical protein
MKEKRTDTTSDCCFFNFQGFENGVVLGKGDQPGNLDLQQSTAMGVLYSIRSLATCRQSYNRTSTCP